MTDFNPMDLFPEERKPEPEFQSALPLVGIDGNAFGVIAQVSKGLRKAGASREYVDDVVEQMMSGDYDHLLGVATRYTEGY